MTQKSTFSAWTVGVVGDKPLNEFVKLFGKLGIMQSHTEWEARVQYGFPGSDGSYQGWSSSSDKTSGFVAAGLVATVAKNLDVRFTANWGPTLKAPSADLIYRF